MKKSIDGQKQVATIKQIVIHPGYDHKSPAKINDIALIQLNRPAEWSEFVQPACLPKPDGNQFSGQLAMVSGWGKTELGKSQLNPVPISQLSSNRILLFGLPYLP